MSKFTLLPAIVITGLLTGVTYAQDNPKPGTFDWAVDEENSVLRLNKDDPSLDSWRANRDQSGDPKREPGPIQLNRRVFGSPFLGIPTFLRRAVAINPEDLVAGKVDVAFMGAPIDFNAGRRGTHLGPQAIRTAEYLIPWRSDGTHAVDHTDTMIDPLEILNVVDYGDAPVEPFSMELSIKGTLDVVREAAETSTTLFISGGSHSMPYASIRGISEANGGVGNVGVLHFDAHQDAQPYGFGHTVHYGNFLRQLVEEGHVEPNHVVQVGMRGAINSYDGLQWQRRVGVETFYMAEIRQRGFKAVADDILKKMDDLPDKIYLSVDLDFYDSSVAIGTTAPEPGGVMPWDFFPLLRALAIKKEIVGVDLVEVNPLLDDRSGSTMTLGVRTFYEALVGMALKKQGITDPWYIHPDLIPTR